jgi:dipeptidyl aminopeptidase/acylaminoacyl peptidase
LFLGDQRYVVLQPTYRGGVGYGEHFRNLNVQDHGSGEVDDAVAAPNSCGSGARRSEATGDRRASHGGTVASYAVAQYPDLFAGGIDLYGVIDRATCIARRGDPREDQNGRHAGTEAWSLGGVRK